jgi:GNAT superfamily N-acetyltransferase
MLAQPTPQILREPHVEVRLATGHLAVLRPLRAQEEGPLVRVFDGMSELSRARRYLTGMAYLPPSVVRRLVDVDGCKHVAWTASIDGDPVGIGRYVAYDHRLVDVALEVVDRWHGHGLGGTLVDTIATIALANGYTSVAATVQPTNHASERQMRSIGLTMQVVDGLLEGQGRLTLPDPPRVDRRAVLAAHDRVLLADGLGRACCDE